MNKIIALDQKIFLLLNGSHNNFLDSIMLWASDKYFWIPFYIFILILLYRYFKLKTILIVVFVGLLITITDQTSVLLFKNIFQRLRPCYALELAGKVELIADGCGGQFGFISNHASNSFALAVFIGTLLKFRLKFFLPFMLFWAGILAYSRIYIGVHYPGDVVCGALWGIFIGLMLFRVFSYVEKKYWNFFLAIFNKN